MAAIREPAMTCPAPMLHPTGEAGVFAGYASIFGLADNQRDVVERGAFSAAIAARGPAGVRMLWQHDPAEPVGAWLSLSEDAYGLRVVGRLALETRRARDAHGLIRAGAVDGLSIGFRPVRARPLGRSGGRRLLELDLWEISIVTFPSLKAARIGVVGR